MNIYKKTSLLSLAFVLVFAGIYTGEPLPYLQGMSPFSSAASLYEEEVFRQIQLEKEKNIIRMELVRLKNKRVLEDKIKKRIRWVISRYNPGLDSQHLQKVPGWIIQESKKYGYDPLFLTAVIITESSFNNWAKSRVGAVGLMQIRPATGYALASETRTRWKGFPTLYDPSTNIALGAYYLNKLMDRFDGDLTLALEAYNHGPTQLVRYIRKGYLPKRYSSKVFRNYDMIKFSPI